MRKQGQVIKAEVEIHRPGSESKIETTRWLTFGDEDSYCDYANDAFNQWFSTKSNFAKGHLTSTNICNCLNCGDAAVT